MKWVLVQTETKVLRGWLVVDEKGMVTEAEGDMAAMLAEAYKNVFDQIEAWCYRTGEHWLRPV